MKEKEYMHWREMCDMPYLGHWDLPLDGSDLVKTISHIEKKEVIGTGGKKERKAVALMTEGKPMIINVTNFKRIEKITGTGNVKAWENVDIRLYFEMTRNPAGGDQVKALRIRATKPKPVVLPSINPKSKEWDGCKKAIASGNFTLADILKKYSITKANQTALCTPTSK